MATVISGLKRCRIYDGSGSLLCEHEFDGTDRKALSSLVMPGDRPINLSNMLLRRDIDTQNAPPVLHLTQLPDGMIRAELAVDGGSAVAIEFGAETTLDLREVWSLLDTFAARFVTLQGRLKDPEATVIDDLLQPDPGD